MSPVRVMVASSSARVAQRLGSLLASHESVEVPRAVGNTSDLVRRAQEQPFDVLLSDLDLTGFEPIEFVRTREVNGRQVRLIRVAGFSAVHIRLADFHVQPFSRDEFLALVRTALID